MNSANERNTTWTPEKLRQLLADKASGMTDIQLGEKHGVSGQGTARQEFKNR